MLKRFAVPVLLALWFAPRCFAALPAGHSSPMLAVHVLAGDRVGQDFCLAHDRGTNPFIVVFISQPNQMVSDFLKNFDAYVGGLRAKGVRGFVVLRGDAAQNIPWAKGVYYKRGLTKTSVVKLVDTSQVADWQPNSQAQTNAWLFNKGKLVKTWALGCPCCEGLLAKIKQTVAPSLAG